MIVPYVVSFLGMLAWAWGADNANWAGKGLGIVLLVAAVGLTLREVLGGRRVKPKTLLITLGIHAVIWVVGILLYDYIMMAVTLIVTCIVGYLFFGSSDSSSASNKQQEQQASEFDLARLPDIVYDDANTQWMKRGLYGDHVEYYNSNGETVTIYNAHISGSTATTSAGNIHW